MLISISGEIVEFEFSMIRQRVKAELDKVVPTGKKLGRLLSLNATTFPNVKINLQ